MSKTLLVAGSRTLSGSWLYDIFDSLSYTLDMPFDKIIHGGAKGVDTTGGAWAQIKDKEVEVFLADWNHHGRAAGYLRNEEMSRHCDAAILVWDGKSKGTKNMMDILLTRSIPFALRAV